MPSGVLYADYLTPNANTATSPVAANKLQTVDAHIVNMASTPATVKVFVGTNNSPGDNKTLVEPVILNKGGKIRIGGAILAATERIVMHTDGNMVAARVTCFEEDA